MARSAAWVPRTEFDRVLGGIDDRFDRARAFASLSRLNTLYMIVRAGSGHIGSSFSAADIVTWLLLAEMRDPFTDDGDVYFSSKGHDVPGLYAALIATGRLDEDLLHRLRRLDGLPGHPDVHTPAMPFNTGSLGMGISKAKGLVLADRLRGRRRRVFVLTGDGELQEGQNWEALSGAVRHDMGELTVVVDHNRLQSDTWVRDVSDLGDLPARFAASGWGVVRCDGHDLHALDAAFTRRRDDFAERPVVIIADTVKGGGCTTFAATHMPAGEWRYRFHSGAPRAEDHLAAYAELRGGADEILAANGLDPVAVRTIRFDEVRADGVRLPAEYGRLLTDRASGDERIVALDADLILDTGLIPFREAHPDRFFECGIAEQDMVSMAGGLAAGGLLPFVHSFSCFLHARPNEQIYNNATEGRRVVYVGSLAGLLPAGPGHSHQAVRDVSALSSVPDLVMVEPAGPAELAAAVDFCRTAAESVYLRLASVVVPSEVVDLPPAPLVPGRGTVLRGSGEIVAMGAGPVVVSTLLRAAEELTRDGIDLTVVNLPWHNRLDPAWFDEVTARAGWLYVVEHQYGRGGQADMVARQLVESAGRGTAPQPRFRSLALTTVPRCGRDDEVLAAHGLRVEDLTALIRSSGTTRTPTHVPDGRIGADA